MREKDGEKRVTSTMYLMSVCVVKVVANRCLQTMLIIQCWHVHKESRNKVCSKWQKRETKKN